MSVLVSIEGAVVLWSNTFSFSIFVLYGSKALPVNIFPSLDALTFRADVSTALTDYSTIWASAGKGVSMRTACPTSRSSRLSSSTALRYS